MVGIDSYLKTVYSDFGYYINQLERICDIKSLNYTDGNVPDYSNRIVQQSYILRYAYAYAYEYYLMYTQAIKALASNNKTISVLSVGCGPLIDYAGLKNSLRGQDKAVNYRGIDLIDWNNKYSVDFNDKVVVYPHTDAERFFYNLDMLSDDVYFFPKSIGELSYQTIKSIANSFAVKRNNKDRFCLCVSMRNSDLNRIKDIEKVQILRAGILEGGYIPDDDSFVYYIIQGNKGICSYEKDYWYPQAILDNMISINSHCRGRHQCLNAQDCGRCMNRYPILKTTEVCYVILTFTRKRAPQDYSYIVA